MVIAPLRTGTTELIAELIVEISDSRLIGPGLIDHLQGTHDILILIFMVIVTRFHLISNFVIEE